MTVRLLYFGIVRERLSRSGEDVELPEGATVGSLLEELAARYDIFRLGAGSIRVAVNRDYVDSSHELSANDEVAVIPPVAGGIGRTEWKEPDNRV
jgi:molybdopterin converting factor subunit 1